MKGKRKYKKICITFGYVRVSSTKHVPIQYPIQTSRLYIFIFYNDIKITIVINDIDKLIY